MKTLRAIAASKNVCLNAFKMQENETSYITDNISALIFLHFWVHILLSLQTTMTSDNINILIVLKNKLTCVSMDGWILSR